MKKDKKTGEYSKKLKDEAMRLYKENGFGCKRIAQELNIKYSQTVETWIRKYKKYGKPYKKKGRPSKKEKAEETKEEELKRLRAENDYLRELAKEMGIIKKKRDTK